MQKSFYFEDSEKSRVIFAACKTVLVWLVGNNHNQWRLVAFINGGASKTIFEMSKSSIHRLPKFKGGVNKFLTKNAIFNSNLYLYK